MTDKKPDIDEFNFDEKTEKNNVLDQSMTASRTINKQNPVAIGLTGVFFVVLLYYFFAGSSKNDAPSSDTIVKEMQASGAPAVVEEQPLDVPEPLPRNVMAQQSALPSAAQTKQQPEHAADNAMHQETALSVQKIEKMLQHLYERQADISEQISHYTASNHKNLKKSHTDLSALIAEVSKDLTELRNQQSQMAKTMGDLSHKIADSNEAMKNIEQIMRLHIQEFQVSEHDLTQAMPPAKYSLHAVIPGRAWLKDGNRIFAVTQGQEIDSYGHVVSIDARQGVVVTSSGQILRYS